MFYIYFSYTALLLLLFLFFLLFWFLISVAAAKTKRGLCLAQYCIFILVFCRSPELYQQELLYCVIFPFFFFFAMTSFEDLG